MLESINKAGAEVVGISKDSQKSHAKFIDKHDLKVTLLSNTEKEVMRAYGSWGIKKMYGREVEGTIRSTFIIDPDHTIAHVWKSVKAKGHAEKVYNKLIELKK